MSNPFTYGQCTYWAWQNASYVQPFPQFGNAKDWIASAQKYGLPTGPTPRVGAIMVLQVGVDGASGFGHVGVVTDFTPTTVHVSQMDVPIGNSNPTIGTYIIHPGMGFIYAPDASPPPPTPKSEETDMAITAARADGTLDRFFVTPDGRAWHTYLQTNNFRDALPGVWAAPLTADWVDANTLRFRGIGWAGGPLNPTAEGAGGTIYECVWRSTAPTWSGPSVVI